MAYEQINFGLFTPEAKAPVCRDFDGETFDPERDGQRLGDQLAAVFHLMKDGEWWQMTDLAAAVGAPVQSVDARRRDLRKEKFGGHTVEKRHVGNGLFEYRLLANVE